MFSSFLLLATLGAPCPSRNSTAIALPAGSGPVVGGKMAMGREEHFTLPSEEESMSESNLSECEWPECFRKKEIIS